MFQTLLAHFSLLAGLLLAPAATVAPVPPDAPPATPAAMRPTTPTMTVQIGPGEPEVTSGTLRMLHTLETFHKDVKSIHATFHQVRVDQVFQDTQESDGELWFRKPYPFRCDYADPNKMITLILEKALYSYVPELKQVEFYTFANAQEREQQLHQILLAFGFDTRELIRTYDIHSSEDEAEPLKALRAAGFDPSKIVLFTFKPRPEFAESSPFVSLKLYVDKASHLPQKIWYQDKDEAEMTLTMTKIETDVKLDDALFDPHKLFPDGVQYIDKRMTP